MGSGREAQQQLERAAIYGMRFGLERIKRLLAALDNPQNSYRTVHVVGTNGKSSTSRMLTLLLAAEGRRVGSYLSPHLNSFRERIRIADEVISEEAFIQALEQVQRQAELINSDAEADDQITQFELLTATGLLALAQADVEIAVIEAGLGGRLDCTNVLPSKVQILTNVDLEHTELLGDTVEAIAQEKLAVVKPGSKLITGQLKPSVAELAKQVADRLDCELIDATKTGLDPALYPSIIGYQRDNFQLALTAAVALIGPLEAASITEATRGLGFAGRLQITGQSPLVVMDSAHNPAGVAATLRSLHGRIDYDGTVVVLSLLADKDLVAVSRQLATKINTVVVTRCASPRAAEPQRLAQELLRAGVENVLTVTEPTAALSEAKAQAGQEGAVLVLGSNYLIGELSRCK